MENFESWYKEKTRLVFGAMKQLKITKNREEFYQIGLIALWEASKRFDPEKGKFDSYAYSYILNRMKTALIKENSYQNRYKLSGDEVLYRKEDIIKMEMIISKLMFDYYLQYLTPLEKEVVQLRFVEDRSIADTANVLNVSQTAVKNRTREAMKRLRKVLIQS